MLLVASLLGLAAVFLFVTSLPAMCPMRVLFHVPCPSCGFTRAARLAVAGDFEGATHMHPLWFIVLPFLAALGSFQLGHYLLRGELAKLHRHFGNAGYVLITLLVAVWLARFLGAFGGPCPI